MPLDTLEIGSGEQRRAQTAEQIIKRALVAIDAAFDRQGQALKPSDHNQRYAKAQAEREKARENAPVYYTPKGWTQYGRQSGEYSHESAPHIRVKRFDEVHKIGGSEHTTTYWSWRQNSNFGWIGRFKTRCEAMDFATGRVKP